MGKKGPSTLPLLVSKHEQRRRLKDSIAALINLYNERPTGWMLPTRSLTKPVLDAYGWPGTIWGDEEILGAAAGAESGEGQYPSF